MFWRVASGSVSSSVEAILSRDSYTLEQLLAEDELVKEIKLPNEQLLEFLLLDQTLAGLMHHIVDPPNEELEGDAKFNIPSAACEVLCCESPQILDAVVGQPIYLLILFTPPKAPLSTDSVMSSFFARVVAHLMTHRGTELISWLRENNGLLESLTDRLENTGIAESIVRLVGADQQTSGSLNPEQLSWVADTSLLPTLLQKMEGKEGTVIAENAAEVLAAIARARMPPLTYVLGSQDSIKALIGLCSSSGTKTQPLVQALTICIALVERGTLWQMDHQAGSAGPLSDRDRELESQAVSVLGPQAAHLLQKLSEDNGVKPLETPYGLQTPLGSARLTVVALIAVLLRTELRSAEEAVMEATLLSLCQSLFISYPFNSILHHKVTSIFSCVLDLGSDELVTHLFKECDFLDWLVRAPMEVTAVPYPNDKRSRSPLRAGYTGHITQIATKLAEAAEARPIIAEYLRGHPGWQKFSASRLQNAHQMEDVNAWECGRPIMSERPAGSSDADDALGLDGDTLNGTLPAFEQNSFGIQSAFHIDSDSDEGSPTRADTLFADAMEYDDDRDNLSASMNGLGGGAWDRDSNGSNPNKGFNQRRRLEIYSDGFMDDMETGMNGHVHDAEAERGSQHQGLGWGQVLNGHADSERRLQNGDEPPDSWENLASSKNAVSAVRPEEMGAENQSPGPVPPQSIFQTRVQDPNEAAHQSQDASQPQPMQPHRKGIVRLTDPSMNGASPPGMGSSPLEQALKPREIPGQGSLDGADDGSGSTAPAIDHAEFRQPKQADEGEDRPSPGHQAGIVQRYIAECMSGRGSSDVAAHPLGSAESDDAEDLTQEIRESLADQDMPEQPDSPQAARGGAAEKEEETLVGNFTKLDVTPDVNVAPEVPAVENGHGVQPTPGLSMPASTEAGDK